MCMKSDWIVIVKGNVNGFMTAIFHMERDAIAYFKTIRKSLDSSKFIITRESIMDKDNRENTVRLTKLTVDLGMTEEVIKQASEALNFKNEPYIKLLEKAMKIVEQSGYSIVKRNNEYLVNIYYKVAYLGLAEVFITSSDMHFDEDSIIIEKENAEELALKITDIINRRI